MCTVIGLIVLQNDSGTLTEEVKGFEVCALPLLAETTTVLVFQKQTKWPPKSAPTDL